jgi:hypothetical protein
MTRTFALTLAGFGFLAAGVPLAAHHSTMATYDSKKLMTLKGVVTEVAWMNPHANLSMDVKDAAGKTVNWFVELPSAGALSGRGWKRGDLKQGNEVTVDVWVSKTVANAATARVVHLPDGRSISGASGWDCGSATQEGCAGPGRLAPVTKQ